MYNQSISIKKFMDLFKFSKYAILYLKDQSYNGEIVIEVYRKEYDDIMIRRIFCLDFKNNLAIQMN